jgi:hypothetical protein
VAVAAHIPPPTHLTALTFTRSGNEVVLEVVLVSVLQLAIFDLEAARKSRAYKTGCWRHAAAPGSTILRRGINLHFPRDKGRL